MWHLLLLDSDCRSAQSCRVLWLHNSQDVVKKSTHQLRVCTFQQHSLILSDIGDQARGVCLKNKLHDACGCIEFNKFVLGGHTKCIPRIVIPPTKDKRDFVTTVIGTVWFRVLAAANALLRDANMRKVLSGCVTTFKSTCY